MMDVLNSNMARFHTAQSAATSNTPTIRGNEERERLIEVTQEFEAMFVKQMLDSMRSSRDTESDLFHGGFAEEVFDDMLYSEYAKKMAAGADFGIARLLQQQFGVE